MDNLINLPNQLDAKKRQCRAIIETPKGCRNKFDYDPDSNLFVMGGLQMDVRIIAVIQAKQTEHGKTVSDDRLLGVAIHFLRARGSRFYRRRELDAVGSDGEVFRLLQQANAGKLSKSAALAGRSARSDS